MEAIRYGVDIISKKIVVVDKDIEIVEYLEGNHSRWCNSYQLGLSTESYENTIINGYYVYTSKRDVDIYLKRVKKLTDECIVTIYVTNFSISNEEIIRLAIRPYEIKLNMTLNKINKIETLKKIQKNNRELCRNIGVFYMSSLDLENNQTNRINIEKFECREYIDDSIEVYKYLVNGYSKIDISDKFKVLKIEDYKSKTFGELNSKIKEIDNDCPRYGYENVYEHKGVLYTVHYGGEENEIELIAFDRFKNYILK
ncbi:MAG: hypothetical protein ACRC1T_09990 [Clostridium chrysemydis]|uniref:hypothetical protein n=1 Tax=Clostridium chrysemydis TaxID=2665504 RepID=UPI003F305E9A